MRPPPRPRKDRAGPDPCPDTRSSILPCLEHPPKKQAAGPCPSCPALLELAGSRAGGLREKPAAPLDELQVQPGTDTPGISDDPRSSSTANTPAPAGQGRGSLPPPGKRSPQQQGWLEVLVLQQRAHHQLLVAEVPEGSHVEGHVGEDNQVLQEGEDGVHWGRKHSR